MDVGVRLLLVVDDAPLIRVMDAIKARCTVASRTPSASTAAPCQGEFSAVGDCREPQELSEQANK